MNEPRTLTQDEAQQRAGLLDVERYDLDVDLTGLLAGPDLRVTSTISFGCHPVGAETFVDCAAEVEQATLNGVDLGPSSQGRLRLTGLEAENVLVVRSVQRHTDQAQGVHRAVDPADGEVYVWMTFEPDDARFVFACFDQPDLKAVFAITVRAPSGWTVLSNTAPITGDAGGRESDGATTWAFSDTPALSTYVPVVNAGPLHELRSRRGGHDLGIYARRSLAPMLERDAEEIFDLTAKGLAFYGEQFAMPFPQERYDQAFMPELSGAMENFGCITWSDSFVYREQPSYAERELRALVLLHEMAHMWFGDMVTMRWWDDLWLNESFAQWACGWSAVNVTEFTDVWAGMLATDKQDAYTADLAPTTHPIRQRIADVDTAKASFDAITYPKGAAVLKQLVAYVGEEHFVAALCSYFRKHAWDNTTLEDLIAELEETSGRDLSGWVEGWLETSGADRLSLERSDGETTLRAESPAGRGPLPHHLEIGVYVDAEHGFALRETVALEVHGERTVVAGTEDADLLLVNDNDLSFAVVQPDAASLRTLLDHGGRLPTAVGRTLAVTTAWNLVFEGTLPVGDLVTCAAGVLARETTQSVIEPLLHLAVHAADYWAPPAQRDELLGALADVCIGLAEDPARELAAVRSLARTATTSAQLDVLATLAKAPELGWRRLMRLAELGRCDDADIDRLAATDPNPDAWVSAIRVRAARPDAESKREAWQSAFVARTVPVGMLHGFALMFWRPGQDAALAPYADEFLDALPGIGEGGMLSAMSLAGAMFPWGGVDRDYPARVVEAARRPEVSPLVAHHVCEQADVLTRMLTARSRG